MLLSRMIGMFVRVGVVRMSQVRVVRSLGVMACFVVLCSLSVVVRSQRVMVGSLFMMMCSFL